LLCCRQVFCFLVQTNADDCVENRQIGDPAAGEFAL
jgi:hypothetical protein